MVKVDFFFGGQPFRIFPQDGDTGVLIITLFMLPVHQGVYEKLKMRFFPCLAIVFVQECFHQPTGGVSAVEVMDFGLAVVSRRASGKLDQVFRLKDRLVDQDVQLDDIHVWSPTQFNPV